MKTRGIRAVPVEVFLALLLVLPACSVKEERTGCPCYVHLIVDEFLRAGLSEAMVAFSSGGLGHSETLDLSPYEGSSYEKQLPRSQARAAVAAGLENSRLEGEVLKVPYGLEADPLWLYFEDFECEGDDKYLLAAPSKQYCNLTIVVTGMDEESEYNCSLQVYAGSSDVELYTGHPAGGKYHATARRVGPLVYAVRIPRQQGNELLLEISPPPTRNAAEPMVLDLGDEFRRAGYDWGRHNLMDASAVVDYASADISFDIVDWDIDGSFGDVEI